MYTQPVKKSRSLIIIDGSNFYFKLKSLNLTGLSAFDYSGFNKYIARRSKIVSATYYIGKVRTDGTAKAQKLFNHQRQLFAQLQKHQVKYSLGYLLKSGGKFHEKGVDVAMAVDMLIAAYEDQVDRIILVSSDTDLLPAIKKAISLGKIVEYVGFSHQPSIALVANCSEARLLTKDDVVGFTKDLKS